MADIINGKWDEVWLRSGDKIVIHKVDTHDTTLKLDTISMVKNGETWWGKFVGWLILFSPISFILILMMDETKDIYFGYWFLSLLFFLFISSLSYILIIVSQGKEYIFHGYSLKTKESLKRLHDEIYHYMN